MCNHVKKQDILGNFIIHGISYKVRIIGSDYYFIAFELPTNVSKVFLKMLTWLNAQIAQSGHLSITNLMHPNELHAPGMFHRVSGSKIWPKTIMVWKDIRLPTWATESQNHKKLSGAFS